MTGNCGRCSTGSHIVEGPGFTAANHWPAHHTPCGFSALKQHRTRLDLPPVSRLCIALLPSPLWLKYGAPKCGPQSILIS
jgi:hypothetical protein